MTDAGELIAGRYRLAERIGQGAMGVVWRARDERLDRVVAVKQLDYDPAIGQAAGDQAALRALREARLTARLRHPHAVTVHDVVEVSGEPYLVMEYLPSRSLADILLDRDRLPADEVARIGAQIASALAAAHAEGVMHRDVTPANVLIGESGVAKIADFGISRATGEGLVTGGGFIAGTPAFLAPEVAGGGEGGFPADVFALGATLYRALEGTPPFGTDDNPIALLLKVAKEEVIPPRHDGPLAEVLGRLLRRDPAERPTMVEAQELFEAVTENRPLPPSRPRRTATRLIRVRRSRRPIVLASAAGAVLLALGVVIGTALVPDGTATVAAPVSSSPPGTTPPSPTTTTDLGCAARYEVTNSWPGGYQVEVTVRNDHGAGLSGWRVLWTLPAGHRISDLWNGSFTVEGSAVTVENASWNAKLDASGSTTFGFIALTQSGSGGARPSLTCRTL
ncbi:serine/threonine protein kinase [Amycolatopsis balhimycina DSM 5908]|uniref:non-specific serine/threonine protein kinase n=1 Tax=Amycolatopsis balhimycina DSM 5908 TaxID=1081091 RepID=A0A428X013_AMYBA|nr:protein kinase [Amycolatopsis balhimycina]RSM48610.1 serine/threonine protein kinase [Amycolatopsis balhimycina DSM 5908]